METVVSAKGSQPTVDSSRLAQNLLKLADVKSSSAKRIGTGFFEFDRVLGGGIVPGSITLISGDPGIGKSTLLLQTAMKVVDPAGGPVTTFLPTSARSDQKSNVKVKDRAELRAGGNPSSRATSRAVLYVSGEESAQQVKIRADRIGKVPQNLYILPDTDLDSVIAASEKISPKLLIVDSIQTLSKEGMVGGPGSIGQIRECTRLLARFAKQNQIPVFIVGHVTKEGNLAGPQVLAHVVDSVLSLEGDGMHNFRLLRSTKNRFGSTFEVGVFEMEEGGMVEVENPSAVFLAQRVASRPGSVVTSTIAGGRPILAEVQALCAPTIFPVPTRRVSGLDFARIQVVIAAISRVAKISLATQDVYVNVAGGLRINEPAADLPAALSIVSSNLGKPVEGKICAFGEVGLLGELRPVGNTKNRIAEAKRLGFSDFVTPEKCKTLEEAIYYSIHGQ